MLEYLYSSFAGLLDLIILTCICLIGILSRERTLWNASWLMITQFILTRIYMHTIQDFNTFNSVECIGLVALGYISVKSLSGSFGAAFTGLFGLNIIFHLGVIMNLLDGEIFLIIQLIPIYLQLFLIFCGGTSHGLRHFKIPLAFSSLRRRSHINLLPVQNVSKRDYPQHVYSGVAGRLECVQDNTAKGSKS